MQNSNCGYLSALEDVKNAADAAVEGYKTMGVLKKMLASFTSGHECREAKASEDIRGHLSCQYFRANQDIAEFMFVALVVIFILALILTCICYYKSKKVIRNVSEKVKMINIQQIGDRRGEMIECKASEPAVTRHVQPIKAIETRVEFEDFF